MPIDAGPSPLGPDTIESTSSLPSRRLLQEPSDADILEVVHHALRTTWYDPGFSAGVQRIKGLLYDKQWLKVFENPAMLEVYAGRWVPSRALCYRELFASLNQVRGLFDLPSGSHMRQDPPDGEETSDDEDDDYQDEEDRDDRRSSSGSSGDRNNGRGEDDGQSPAVKEQAASEIKHIVSLGGGAASDLLAIAALVRSCMLEHPSAFPSTIQGESEPLGEEEDPPQVQTRWKWTGIDIGRWDHVVDKFRSTLETEWDISPDILDINFVQGNLLEQGPPSDTTTDAEEPSATAPALEQVLTTRSGPTGPTLITLLFTLCELFAQSRPATIAFLHTLTRVCEEGTLLLVVDSASDISSLPLGNSRREWPVYMVLDAILTAPSAGNARPAWKVVRKVDSRWYRLPEGVGAGWPVKLENTRYWMRLYERV